MNNTLIVCVYFFLPIFTTDAFLVYETLNSELDKLLTCKLGSPRCVGQKALPRGYTNPSNA